MVKKNSENFDITRSWIVVRQDVETKQEGGCNMYALMQGSSGYCYGHVLAVEFPDRAEVVDLFRAAFKKDGAWPEHVLISKEEPFLTSFESICGELNLVLVPLVHKDFFPHVREFRESFNKLLMGGRTRSGPPLTEVQQKEMDAFVPKTYGPCYCGSGKKFKFCCKKAFKDIVFAMCEAEEGHLDKVLYHMKEAEAKVGTTAGILCRYAVCWSFFDKKKMSEYLDEALKLNPGHPRANYLLGIEAVESGDYPRALTFYQKAIENYPEECKFHLNEVYNNIGSVYYTMKEYGEAKSVWEKALTLLPTDVTTRDNLFGLIYENPMLSAEIREISPFMKKFIEREC